MKKLSSSLALAACFGSLLTYIQPVFAQGTAFTYQGQLQNNGIPGNGNYDFTFALFNNSSTNTGQVGATLLDTNVGVTNGLFTVTLDFGPVFSGNATWLSIEVRTNGGSSFTPLNPLQPLTPTPYAIYSPNAGTAANVTGPISLSQLPAAVLTNNDTNNINLTGSFSGNGSQLTNLSPAALAANGAPAPVQTNVYATNGVYSFTIPGGIGQITVKLWGAGGQGSQFTAGGGGAFSEVTLTVTPGQQFVAVVGQSGGAGGGFSSGDAGGGEGGGGGGENGGQASSLFQYTGTDYIMKAVAGGGGGGGYLYGANAGQASGTGSGYAANATTTGVANLDLIGGQGQTGSSQNGGCGGGYGGGTSNPGNGQANGGGSYGTTTLSGSYQNPANTSDPNYVAGAAVGGTTSTGNGADGLAVVIFSTVPTLTFSAPLQAPEFFGNGSGLTSLTAANLTGALPAISGASLTGLAHLTGGNTFNGTQIFTNGFIGIGTTPLYPLDVASAVYTGIGSGAYYYLYESTAETEYVGSALNEYVGIRSDNWILANGLISPSDRRIKNIVGLSDTARDLATLMGIEITDYTYKDTVAKGNRPQKKVIAQQLEQVYPQAVSRTKDVVPDIYKKATVQGGWVQLATDLKVGERVKLIGQNEEGIHEVLEVRDGAFRTDYKPATGKVFVYGREVEDFRTVDYDAISMLNVSATQELNRRVKKQTDELAALERDNQALRQELAEQKEAAGRMQADFSKFQKIVTQFDRNSTTTLTLNQTTVEAK
jgi:hypothetical protein